MVRCEIPGCDGRHEARGWCPKHYQRWRRYGDPLTVTEIHGDDEARFLSYVQVEGECWRWIGELTEDGYGRFLARGVHGAAHRWAYEHFIEPIPDGLVIDHLCRNHGCVNPAHLEPVTQAENLRRGDTFQAANAAKTHCPQGHPYDEVNTYITRSGTRSCRVCKRAQHRAWKERQAA
jgi:hypothetical protein